MNTHYDEPVYLISVVAKVLNIHPQTLRQYEKEGLVCPNRTNGKMRLYSERDIDQIKTILRLTRNMGINLAGVDVVLRLKKQMEKMEKELFDLNEELQRINNLNKTSNKKSLVKVKNNFDIIFYEDKE